MNSRRIPPCSSWGEDPLAAAFRTAVSCDQWLLGGAISGLHRDTVLSLGWVWDGSTGLQSAGGPQGSGLRVSFLTSDLGLSLRVSPQHAGVNGAAVWAELGGGCWVPAVLPEELSLWCTVVF